MGVIGLENVCCSSKMRARVEKRVNEEVIGVCFVVLSRFRGEIDRGTGLRRVLDVLQRWSRFDVKPVDALSGKRRRGLEIRWQMSVTQFHREIGRCVKRRRSCESRTLITKMERSGLVRVSQEGTGWLAKADGIGKG